MRENCPYPLLRTPDWLLQKCAEKASISSMMKEIGCSFYYLKDAMADFGIEYKRDWSEIHRENHRKRRPWQHEDHEWMAQRHDVEGKSQEEIAAEIGCATPTVGKALLRLGIATRDSNYRREKSRVRKKIIPQLNDKDWLNEQIIIKERSFTDIAEEIGCTTAKVGRAANRHGIVREKGEWSRLRPDAIPELQDAEWLRREFIEKDRTTQSIADELKCSFWTVQGYLYKWRIRKYPDRPTKNKNSGKVGPPGTITKDGYILVWNPEHPNANGRGYVPQHRLVCEEALNRLLGPLEEVHHLNEKRDQNNLENLLVMRDHGAHVRFHNDPPAWVPRCECCGKPRPEILAGRPPSIPLEWDG
jgi:hypothetical protein